MSRSDGFSRARLGHMSEVMRGYVERGEVARVVTLLSRRDEVHVIASMTKPITAAAAMILVEEAKLRLDDPVDQWLPELADRRVLRAIDGPLDDTVPANPPDHAARSPDVPAGFWDADVPVRAAPDPEGDGGGGSRSRAGWGF